MNANATQRTPTHTHRAHTTHNALRIIQTIIYYSNLALVLLKVFSDIEYTLFLNLKFAG